MALISAVIPVYGNSGSLKELKARLEAVARRLPADRLECIFVDDGSADDSFSVLEGLSQKDTDVKVLKLSRNFGSNAATLAGLAHAAGDCAVVISADLQDPPEIIPDLVRLWKNGNDVVLAARRNRQDGFLAGFFSGIFNWLFRRLVFKDFPAGGFDFMLVDRKVKDILTGFKEKNSYVFGQVMWVGFRRAVVYYDRVRRPGGSSGWTFVKKIKYFIDAFTAFSYVPVRLMSCLGFLMAGIGILYALAVIFLRVFTSYKIPVGWASVTVIILTVSGTQLVLMGILGEYLWRVLDESRSRPLYLIEKTLNAGDPATRLQPETSNT